MHVLQTIAVLFLAAGGAHAATYYVAPAPLGSNDQPGTREKPWATLQHAAGQVRPGDTVLLLGGTYALERRVTIRAAGEPGAWITFAAAPGEEPILDAGGVRPANQGEASSFGAITLDGASYVRLVGLRLRNSYHMGILVRKPSHHVDIAGCKVDMTFAPGIGAWNCADLRAIGCEVTHANTQKMRLYGDARRECPHEAISIAGVDRFEAAWNHVHHCDKEGIDVKEVSKHGVVHHNYVHDMPRQGLYADAWFGLLEDVEFASNVVHDCEWGQVISVEGRDSELRDVRIHHNVLYRNRASGVFFGTWGTNGPRSGVRIENNTLWGNGRPRHWAGPTGNIDVRSTGTRDLLVARNLCADGGAFEIATFLDPAAEAARFAELGIRVEGNLVASETNLTDGPAQYGRPYVYPGKDAVTADPMLTAPEQGDFRLRPGSPAFAPGGTFGAFGPDARKLPDVPSRLEGFPPFTPDTTGWPECLRP